jgi:hypothetical protein
MWWSAVARWSAFYTKAAKYLHFAILLLEPRSDIDQPFLVVCIINNIHHSQIVDALSDSGARKQPWSVLMTDDDRLNGTVKGFAMVLIGIVIWIGCAYIRPNILGISEPAAVGALILVFLSGFVLVLSGTGIVMVKNGLWD